MKGKKILSLSAALVLSLGVMASFAGCGLPITSASTADKIFDAMTDGGISRLNISYRTVRESERHDAKSNVTLSDSTEKFVKFVGYQTDDLYADFFQDVNKVTKTVSADTETSSEDGCLSLSFSRVDTTYSYSGDRSVLGVEKGDFDGAINGLKNGKAALTSEEGVGDPDIDFSDDTILELGEFMKVFDCKVVWSVDGYCVTLDAVQSIGDLLRDIEKQVKQYEKQPDMTVKQFFSDDSVKKLLQILYFEKPKSVAAKDFGNLLLEGTGRNVVNGYPSTFEAYRFFYDCLSSENLYQKLTATQPIEDKDVDISSSDGTIGGMYLSALFGTPAEAKDKLLAICNSPETVLLNYVFGFNGTQDEGDLKYEVSVKLDNGFNVREVTLSTSYKTVTYDEPDQNGDRSYEKSAYSAEVSIGVPKKNPKLTNLQGIAGYVPPTPSTGAAVWVRPKIGTYESKPEKLTLILEWIKDAEDTEGKPDLQLDGTVTVKAEITENKATLTVTFTAVDDPSFVISETEEYKIQLYSYHSGDLKIFSRVEYQGCYWNAGVAYETGVPFKIYYRSDGYKVRVASGEYFNIPTETRS